MFEDVEAKLERKNKILFSRDSACLQELIRLIRLEKHRTLVLWAFECVKEPLAQFERQYKNEPRPRIAFECCQKWAHGEIKMPIAKRAILDCHSVCKELKNDYLIALCHAIGQGLSTVHVETHAIGLPMYELTSIVIQNREEYEDKVQDRIKEYTKILTDCRTSIDKSEESWAEFLLRDDIPNRENILWERRSRL